MSSKQHQATTATQQLKSSDTTTTMIACPAPSAGECPADNEGAINEFLISGILYSLLTVGQDHLKERMKYGETQ